MASRGMWEVPHRGCREKKECSHLVSPLREVLKTFLKFTLHLCKIRTSLAGEAGIKVEKFISRVYLALHRNKCINR